MLFEEVLRQQPAHARALCGLGSIALRRGEVDRGFELVSHAASLAPNDGFTIGNLAVAYMARDELPQAEDCSRRALDLESGSADLHANLATVLAARGDIENALVAQLHAVSLDPDSAIQHFNLANILIASGDPTAAAAEFSAAVELDPGHTGALNNLALLHKQAGRLDHARALLDEARLHDPLNPELLANQADLMLRTGQSEQALEQIRRAVSLAPRSPMLQNAYGAVLLELGRLDEAGKVLADAVRLAPEDMTIIFTLARLLRRRGQLDAAQTAIERIAATTQKHNGAADRFAAELLLLRGHYDEAWDRIAGTMAGRSEPFADLELGPEAELDGIAVRLVALDGAASLFAARCLPAMADRGVDITVVCPPMMAPLFEALPAVRTVLATAELNLQALAADGPPLLHLDALPLRLRITPDAPSPAWPLFPVDRAEATGAPDDTVGLWWEGPGPGLALLEALAGTEGAPLVSLQSGPPREAARPLLEVHGIEDRGGDIRDFGALAARIAALGRVVVPNGPVAHLAAAMGVETWVLVDRDGSWYWPGEAGPMPWYPNVRVFRQSADGSWSAAFEAIRQALAPDPPEAPQQEAPQS